MKRRIVGRNAILFWGIWLFLLLVSEADGFEIKGFGDVNVRKSTLRDSPDHNGSFALGDQVDFFVSYLLTDRIDFLSEMILSEPEEIDIVQRFHIGYLFDDALKVRVGRFHNTLGYWNPFFHHGTFMHITIERPAFLEFEYEAGILPVHMVGVWTSGRFSSGPVILGYDFSVGNGSRIEKIDPLSKTGGELDPNTFEGDNNRNKAISFRLQVSPRPMPQLSFMGFGNVGTVEGFESKSVRTLKVEQLILGAAAVYVTQTSGFNLLSEFYWVRDEDRLLGPTYTNLFYYIQAGYTFDEELTPYARYEQMQVAEGDPYMTALSAAGTRKALIGIRREISAISALKGELRLVDIKRGDEYWQYAIQWAFTF